MKTSWLIGCLILWLAIFLMSGVVSNTTTMSGSDVGVFESIFHLVGANSSETTLNVVTVLTDIWIVIKGIAYILLLWFPTLWTGYWVWFWYLVCLPVCLGVAFSIISMVRGVGSS